MNKSKYKDDFEIVVCDNGSENKSIKVCRKTKTKYLICKTKGYGATLRNEISNSKADYIVMLDCDLSYDEKDIPKMIDLLDNNDFVIGNRFKETISESAMPKVNFIGSIFLTKYANLLFHTKSHDYHCGLRAFKRKKIIQCNLETNGFEFASEMIIKAKLNKLSIKKMHTNSLLRYWAVNVYLVNTDSYQTSTIQNYAFQMSDDGYVTIIPWDYNYTFGGVYMNTTNEVINYDINSPTIDCELKDRPLLNLIFNNDNLKEKYYSYLRDIVVIATDGGKTSDNKKYGKNNFINIINEKSKDIIELEKKDKNYYTSEEIKLA